MPLEPETIQKARGILTTGEGKSKDGSPYLKLHVAGIKCNVFSNYNTRYSEIYELAKQLEGTNVILEYTKGKAGYSDFANLIQDTEAVKAMPDTIAPDYTAHRRSIEAQVAVKEAMHWAEITKITDIGVICNVARQLRAIMAEPVEIEREISTPKEQTESRQPPQELEKGGSTPPPATPPPATKRPTRQELEAGIKKAEAVKLEGSMTKEQFLERVKAGRPLWNETVITKILKCKLDEWKESWEAALDLVSEKAGEKL